MSERKRAVLITGALGGIGQSLCTEFRKSGYFVIGTDLREGTPDCDAFMVLNVCDLCREAAAARKFRDQVAEILAPSQLSLHAVINNAATQILNSTEDITIEQWNDTLQTNLLAPFMIIQTFLDLLEMNSGCALNIASVHATATKPSFVCYATSKSALVGMTRALAVDLGSKIRVNAISPAAVATPMLLAGFEGRDDALQELAGMHPTGRIGDPAEIAKAAIFLCSDAASFITGSCLSIDGGIRSRLHDPV